MTFMTAEAIVRYENGGPLLTFLMRLRNRIVSSLLCYITRGGSRGRVEGVVTPPLVSFQTCLATHVHPFFMPKMIL